MYDINKEIRWIREWKLLILFSLLLIRHFVQAQLSISSDTIAPSSVYSVGIGTYYGFVSAHSKEVQNTHGAKPWGIELDINKQLLRNDSWDECKCYPRTGFVISYFNFDNKDLGHSINAAWYIEPFLNTSNRFNVSMK